MADYIERGPLLEAFKAKCCEDCPGGYDRARCHSWCDAADEIALVEDAPAVVPDAQRWRKTTEEPPTEVDANEDGDVLSQQQPRRRLHNKLAVEHGGSFPGKPPGLDANAKEAALKRNYGR